MNKKINKIPKFKSIKEEAEFWDTHSFADYWYDAKPVRVVYKPNVELKETMTVRLAPSLKKTIEKVAKSYGISTSTLIRMWVIDKLRAVKTV